MTKIENNITSLTIEIDDVVKEISLPNNKEMMAFELVQGRYSNAEIVELVSVDSAQGLQTDRLAAYRAWYDRCKEVVANLDMAALNEAAMAKHEADRIEAEAKRKVEEELAAKKAAEEEAERLAAEEEERKKREEEEAQRIAAENSPERKLERAKAAKIAEIEAYNTSSAVDEFTLGGNAMWLKLEERKDMRQSLIALRAQGVEEFTYWYGMIPVTLPVAQFEMIMNAVEVYALECLNCAQQHKYNVSLLTSVEEVEGYDVKSGYPEKLAF